MNQLMRKIEVDEATAKALEKRAAEIGASVAAVVSELVRLDQQPADISDEELAALDTAVGENSIRGRADRTAKWLETWGILIVKPWPPE